MSGALSHYDAACAALVQAKTLDEVRELSDKAAALQEYGRRAKNRQLEIDAAEVRIRAERRFGELLAEMKADGRLAKGGQPYQATGSAPEPVGEPEETPPGAPLRSRHPPRKGEGELPVTLAEIGVDKKLSSRAQKLAAIPETDFAAQLAGWREKAEAEGERVSARLVRGEAQLDKRERREKREGELGAKIRALPEKRYGVILADPPWRFEPRSRETGLDRAADNHYPTLTTSEIVAMNVMPLAADDCVLFLWATSAMLPQAITTMVSWGFDYRSHVVWKKVWPGERKGTGYWFRNEHELLLVGVRGNPPAPAPGLQWGSVINAKVGRHSEKPENFHQLVEAYFPSLPKIELFRRGSPRAGWDAWGNEAEAGEVKSFQGSDGAGLQPRENPELAARSDSRSSPEGGSDSVGAHRASEPPESDEALQSRAAGAESQAKAVDEADAGPKAHSVCQAELGAKDEGCYRETPVGQPKVPDLVRPGDIVRTSYGTGPYRVVEVKGPLTGSGFPGCKERYPEHWSLCLVHATKPPKKNGAYVADSWVNEIVAVDGRLLKLFEANADEVFVERVEDASPPSSLPDPVGQGREAGEAAAPHPSPSATPSPSGRGSARAAEEPLVIPAFLRRKPPGSRAESEAA